MADYTEFLTPDQLAIEEEAWRTTRLYARNAQVVLDVVDQLRDNEPFTVIEFGCATGWVARKIVPAVSGYIGVDRHPAEIAMARARTRGVHPEARVWFTTADVRWYDPAQAARYFGRKPSIACAFAFLKHFGRGEWVRVLKTVLDCAGRFAAFDVNVSGSGAYLDDGPWPRCARCGFDRARHPVQNVDGVTCAKHRGAQLWPHLWVPETQLCLLLEHEGFRVVECTTMTACPQGWEKMLVVERVG